MGSVLTEVVRRVVRIEDTDYSLVERYPHSDPVALASFLVLVRSDPQFHWLGRPRASSLYSACIRKHVLGKKHRVKTIERLSVQSKLTFGFGNAVHHWLQNDPAVFGSRRTGFWKCLACGKTTPFGPPPSEPCRHCGARPDAFIYKEHSLSSDDPTLTGHPDMFLSSIYRPNVRVAEFKTIEGDAYEKLSGPMIEHVWQLLAYIYLCSREGSKIPMCDPNLGYIFYFAKKIKQGMFPVKCFPIKLDRTRLRPIIDKANEYKRAQVEKGWLPVPHSECARTEFTHYRATSCEVSKECLKAL